MVQATVDSDMTLDIYEDKPSDESSFNKFFNMITSPPTKGTGKRYNADKVRHDLLPPFAINEVAKVFTKGAVKYGDRNWENGMDWNVVMASLKRHINAFESGEDLDVETKLLHMSHVATNAIFLTEYYRIYPQGDKRTPNALKVPLVALDIDGVIANFGKSYKKFILDRGLQWYPYEEQIHWNYPYQAQRTCWNDVLQDKDFWLNMEPLCSPNLPFEPIAYVTARQIPQDWTEEWLVRNGFPSEPVVTVGSLSKVAAVKKTGAEVFIDDCFKNFRELTMAGVYTYLMDQPYNRRYDVGVRRIDDLDDLITGQHLNGKVG